MKKILFLFFCYQLSYSQNLQKVDKIIFSYPTDISVENLSKRIDYDFNTKIEKVRAIYTWLAININYDFHYSKLLTPPLFLCYTDESDRIRREEKRKNNLIFKTLTTKRSQCEGYAFSFKKLCDKLNITNQLVYGYAKTNPNNINIVPKFKNHVWNAVQINKKWIFIDVTWGSENISIGLLKKRFNDNYFNIDKNSLNLTHFPVEKRWRKYTHQKNLQEFCNQPIFGFGYIKSNIKILTPLTGKIVISQKGNIILTTNKNTKNSIVLYCYNDCNYLKKADINLSKKHNTLIFSSPKSNSILNIFFNQKLALQYKVVVK